MIVENHIIPINNVLGAGVCISYLTLPAMVRWFVREIDT